MERNTLHLAFVQSIPRIIEQHLQFGAAFHEESAKFLETHHELLTSAITEIQSTMIEALFLSPQEYQGHLASSGRQGYEQGLFAAKLFGSNIEIVLALSQNLNLTAHHIMQGIIEENVPDAADRLQLHKRLTELNWNRFSSFVQGYLGAREEQLDGLHGQKVSVMGQMASGMAHEIRNPLAAIKGFAQLVKHRLSEPVINVGELSSYLELSISEVDTLNGLVTDFLQLAHKNANAKQDTAIVDVKQVLLRVLTIVNKLILSDNIDLSVDIGCEELSIRGVASQLEQVFLNLLKNGIDALSPPAGSIHITAGLDASQSNVTVRIADNGTGMSKETLASIWKPFYTTKAAGTGIGLPICKQLVESHGGRIGIESELGRGTTVTVTLPYIQAE